MDARESITSPSLLATNAEPTTALENGNNQAINHAPIWNSNSDINRSQVRSPVFGMSVSDAYKLRHCMSMQCGRGYEGIPPGGSCQPIQSGSYPPYIHQHQIAVPMRAVQHHHHHPASGASCHPHQAQSAFGPFQNVQNPHTHSQMERVMHCPSAATQQQMRSIALNHYSSNSGCIHQAPPGASSGGGYFTPPNSAQVAVSGGGTSYVDYGNHQSHHHNGPGMPPATTNSSAGSYRTMATAHHHSKVINPSQAAAIAAYQNVYHQYTQYFHHPSMMQALQNQQTGTSEYGWNQNQNMIGIQLNAGPGPSMPQMQHQPQARLFPFMNRVGVGHGQPVPPFHQHSHHHHGFPSRHHVTQNCLAPNQPPNQPVSIVETANPQNQSGTPTTESSTNETKSNSSSEAQSSRKESANEIHSKKNRKGVSHKTGSSKISSTSSEKSSKAKATKSITRLRDRQLRLVVGQKKKSSVNISGNSCNRKHKPPAKASTLVVSFSSNKRLTGDVTDSEGVGTIKRSKKSSAKRETDDDVSVSSTVSTSVKSEDEQSKPEEEEFVESKEQEFGQYYLEDGLEEEYVPTPEEMIEYLERLNACSNLNLPLHHAYSVFEDNEVDKNSSDCSVSDTIEESECLNCLTWQQQQYDICPSRPPPGFEHLSRPAFPIELYDASLLGNLIGSQMPRGSVQVTSPDSYFEDAHEVLTSLTCCEKHAIDKIWNMKKSAGSLREDLANYVEGSEWDSLDKAIRNVLDDWTEELYFRKKIQQILFGLNLHEVYDGCCKPNAAECHEPSSNIVSFGKKTLGFTPLISREEQSQIRYFIDDSVL